MKFHTLRECAAMLRISESTVSALIQRGKLRGVNASLSDKSKKPRWRISDEALAAFVESRQSGPSQAPTKDKRRRKSTDVIQFYK
jgi:transposase